MTPNVIVVIATAIIPMILGMLYYNPALAGNAWLKEVGLTQDQMKENQKPLKFLLGFICNILLAFGLFILVNHEFAILGLVGGDVELLKAGTTGGAFLAEYGGSFARFSHGALHGAIGAVVLAIPFIGHKTLWSGKSFKLFLLDFVFWLICMVLMGGIIAQWGATAIGG